MSAPSVGTLQRLAAALDAAVAGLLDTPRPQRQLVVRVCCAIGAADGDIDERERAVVRRMCSELGLNSANFSL